MSTAAVKFTCFELDLGLKKHDFSSDTFRLLLTNAAPDVADTVVDTTTTTCTIKSTSNAAEIAAGNGYTKKGIALTVASWSLVTSLATLQITAQPVWTAGPSNMATFEWAILYNDSTGTTATRPLICYWDRGVATTLVGASADTATFNINIADVLQGN